MSMNDPETTIPLLQSLKWTMQWSAAVVLRHPVVVAAYVAGGIVWAVVDGLAPLAGGPVALIYFAALVPLALLTHNEVLRGPSSLDEQVLGPGYSRAIGYLLDTIVISILAIVSALPPAILLGVFVVEAMQTSSGHVFELALVLVLVVTMVVATSRLALRLPARALGTPISWGDAWRLGQGNMLPLCVAPIIISIGFVLVEGLADGVLPGLLSGLISVLAVPAQVIVLCAFLSVAYGQLRRTPAVP